MSELSIRYRPVTELAAYAKNARTHSPEQVAQIAASIEEFGWTNPILVDEEGGLLAGHGRVAAALLRGDEQVPTVTVAGLSQDQKRALVIADNRIAMNAGWDDALLAAEIGDLKASGFDLGVLGFADFEIAGLLDTTAGLVDPEETPPPPANPISRPGDVWVLGRHRITCGDATQVEDVNRVMQGRRADLCLTDPPYGLGDTTSEKNDYDAYHDTRGNLVATITGFFPLAQKTADVVVLTPGNGNTSLYPAPSWTMAWFTPAGVGRGPWGFCCWQPLLCYGKDPKLANGKGCHPDALVHTESAEDFGHPCTKPIKFWSWLMERTSEPDALIFEPFSGSGTTIIAAEMTGRCCYAIELSPAYVDVAVRRWEQFTGEKAHRESDGAPFVAEPEAIAA